MVIGKKWPMAEIDMVLNVFSVAPDYGFYKT